MSKVKNRGIYILIILAFLSFFAFGCEKELRVDDIYFAEESITLVVGESYKPNIIIQPSYADNTGYTLSSSNDQYLSVNGDTITANKVTDSAVYLQVTSSDNNLKTDIIRVYVIVQTITLDTPRNLTYNSDNQSISFSAVEYAQSYILRVNGQDINIGNVTNYSLADLSTRINGNVFDTKLNIQVRAVANTNTSAYKNSELSSAIMFYQTSAPSNADITNGVLSYSGNADKYAILFNDDNILSTSLTTIDLTLDAKYAGMSGELSVVAMTEGEEIGVQYYNSQPTELNVNVLDVASANVQAGVLSWNNVMYAGSYNIYMDSKLQANVQDNFISISDFADYGTIVNNDSGYNITIDPILYENSKNILRTNAKSEALIINKLSTPIVINNAGLISWDNIENATQYVVEISYVLNAETKKESMTISNNSIDISANNFPSNIEYTISVKAINTTNSSIYYLDSDYASIQVFKEDEADIYIENYKLYINSTIQDKYLVKIDDNEPITITADSNITEYDLTGIEFNVGEHSISVCHLGDENSSSSNATLITFVQLGLLDNAQIENGVASASSSLQFETLLFEIYNGQSSFYSTTGLSLNINTTEQAGEGYLPSGNYKLYISALGDGSKTFSSKEKSELDFEVLATPTFDFVNKDSTTISFSEIENAKNYLLLFNEQQIELNTNSYEFDISAGQTIEFFVQAIGNGSNTLSSNLSQGHKVIKLNTPSLSFNNTTDVIEKIDNNDAELVNGYSFVQVINGMLTTIDYDFNSPYTQFSAGENNFTLMLIARDADTDNNISYLNSDSVSLMINVINGETEIYIDSQNRLVIKSQDLNEHALLLNIISNDERIELEGREGTLSNKNKDINLNYTFDNGVYYVEILNNDYTLKISTLSEFYVQVKLLADDEGMANSTLSESKTIEFENPTTFNVEQFDDENIAFSNLAKNYTEYALLIDGNKTLPLTNDSVSLDADAGVIKVKVAYIYENIEENTEVISVAVISLNNSSNAENPTISKVGQAIKIARNQLVDLNAKKDNTQSNNSIELSFNLFETTYAKSYVLEIYNKSNEEAINVRQFTFTDQNDTDLDGVISLYLDDYISSNLNDTMLSSEIFVRLYVKSNATDIIDGETVYIFNSPASSELNYTLLDSVSDIKIKNGELTFSPVENAVGYDVYKLDGSNLVKINNNLIIENHYSLADMSGNMKIFVRAVSDENLIYSNSDLSAQIQVNKLNIQSVNVENGDLVLNLDPTTIGLISTTEVDANTDISTFNGVLVRVINGNNIYYFTSTSEGVKILDNKFIIEASKLLNYGVDNIQLENLKFNLITNYIEEETIYYLNSNAVNLGVYGLLRPTNLIKIADSSNEQLEYISWKESELNHMTIQDVDTNLTAGYVLRVRVGDNIYYSTDINLKYADNDKFLSYDNVITSTSIPAPYGYDLDGDGLINDNERFIAGVYYFAVKAVPNSIDGVNIVSSAYSDELIVNIMVAPSLTIKNGQITWDQDNDATGYIVSIFDQNMELNTTPIFTYTASENFFDFSGQTFDSLTGIYGVKVQSISTKNNVLNSQISEGIYVFRSNEAESIEVDDGNLILEANQYFTNAEIEFVDNTTGRKEYIYFNYEDIANDNIDALKSGEESGWLDYIDNQDEIKSVKKILIKINDSNILNITQGRSYTINVRLIGNSNNDFGVINSKTTKNISQINVVKLSQSASNVELVEVNKGVFSYNYLENYDGINLNFNFNNSTGISPFFEQVKIYRVLLETSSAKHYIYAIDFNNFNEYYSLLDESDYFIFSDQDNLGGLYAYVKYNYTRTDGQSGSLYFNVYKNNEINLRDYDYLYYYDIITDESNSEIIYTSSGERAYIDLASGGSFVISINLLGGDSNIESNESSIISHIAYINSNAIQTNTFVRYSDNNLTAYNGLIKFNDLMPEDDLGAVIDYPIYRLVVTPLNEVESKIIYVYYTSEEDARQVVNDQNAIYVKAEFVKTLPDSVLFDMSKYFTAGTYQVTIQTLAGLGNDSQNSDYLLNARLPINSTVFKKITDTTFRANLGVLNFDMAYVYDNNVINYVYNYEITLSNGQEEYVFEINENTSGITIDNNAHTISYELPDSIQIGEEIITIDNSANYTIKIRALAFNSQDRINGTYAQSDNEDIVLSFTRSSGVENVRIEDGVLKFVVIDRDNFSQARIKLTYLDSTSNECIVLITTRANEYIEDGIYQYHYYEFSYAVGSTYPIQGGLGNMQLDSGIDYNVSVQVLGKNGETAILNSNYSQSIIATRLARVDTADIKSQDGILTWNVVENCKEYIVTLSGEDTYTFKVNTNSIDFETTLDEQGRYLPSGDYKISIRSLGDEILNSRASNKTEEFTRLAQVSNIRIDPNNLNSVIWDEVSKATRYEVIFTYGENEPITQYVQTNSCIAPSGMSGAFTIKVRALSQGEGKTLNGTYGSFTSSTDQPQAVGAVQWDSTNYFYYFATASDFSSGDRILVSYDFRPYIKTLNGYTISQESEQVEVYINYGQSDAQIMIGDSLYYFYQPTRMGLYTSVVVQIERTGSLYSSASRGDDLDFNIFAYGSGTSLDPYGLGTDTHLLNIKSKPNAIYELYSSISLQSVDIDSRVNENGAIVCDEFSGTINGGGYSIIGIGDISLNSRQTFGLFKKLNGATIENLMIGSQDSNINITNSFANNVGAVIQLGLLASYSENSNISEVNIYNMNFIINSSTTISGAQIYVGGMFAQAVNTTISQSSIQTNIEFNATISATSTIYLAGAVAEAKTTDISTIDVTFTLTQSVSSNLFTYVGGIVGFINGGTDSNYAINESNANVTMSNVYTVYFGGIAGVARNIDITASETSGRFANTNLTGGKYIGGIVGMGTSVRITESDVYLVFEFNIANTSALYIGALAGYLNTINNIECSYDLCNIGYDFINGATTYTTNNMNIGVYGYRSNDVITGTCERI